MKDIITEGIKVDFNQGLDIRLVNQDNVRYLKKIKFEQLRFAFDDIAYESSVRQGISLLLANGIASRRLSFYVLQGFGDNDTAIERVRLLQSFNVDIYPMAYKDATGKEPRRKLSGEKIGNLMFHGPRHNKSKFLRLVGRLPE